MGADKDKYSTTITVHLIQLFHGKNTCIVSPWGAVGRMSWCPCGD